MLAKAYQKYLYIPRPVSKRYPSLTDYTIIILGVI